MSKKLFLLEKRTYYWDITQFLDIGEHVRNLVSNDVMSQPEASFENPFHLEDLMVFDDDAWQHILEDENSNVTLEQLAQGLHGGPEELIERVKMLLPRERSADFMHVLCLPLTHQEQAQARRHVLNALFWELTYWKTPELYEELTQGEPLHAGIFERLEPKIYGKTVLDAGAGSGRATFQLLQYGAQQIYAVEPSPGLLRILKLKVAAKADGERIQILQGRFDALPLGDHCVDLALSCSAFTSDPAQGGEAGLAELVRVTKVGGHIVIIWPRIEDYAWLEAHGFQHIVLPLQQDMCVQFRSLESALQCIQRFYAHNEAVVRYVLAQRRPLIPFSVIGVNPPCDYYIR